MVRYILFLMLFSVLVPINGQTTQVGSIVVNKHNAAFLAKVDCNLDVRNLEYLGIRMGSQVGDIVTLYGVDLDVKVIRNVAGIKHVRKARTLNPNMNRAIPDMRVDSVYQGYQLNQGYTGKNVLIGITDWGFDYSHPNFYDTALQYSRIVAAWDQFKTSGPHPMDYNYGTEYTSESEILAAQSDTAGIYDYAYHGSHVAGIAGGSGAGTNYRGVAYEAGFLMVSLRLDEAGALDAFAWMKQKADELQMPLVVNMSWGLYYIGSMDGTGLLSEAIDNYSKQGVIFVTSAGNNGGETFHIKKSFDKDTMWSGVGFNTYTNPLMWGQSISMWGEPGEMFNVELLVLNSNNEIIHTSPTYGTNVADNYIDTFVVINADTVFYNLTKYDKYEFNDRPTMRLRIRERSSAIKVALRSHAKSGTVHYWNVVELTNDAGNWGGTFEVWLPGWSKGDDEYSLGDPASTKSVIAVGAHTSEVRLQNGNVVGGRQANFTSKGPTLDGRRKPEISAPGVSVASSVSSFTTQNFTQLQSVEFNGRQYPFSRISGTSMASPAVAGVVALMLQANPNLTEVDVKQILKMSARLDNNTGTIKDTSDLSWGWGKINASKAVHIAESWIPIIIVPINEHKTVYPNPASDEIRYGSQQNETCKIYSMQGQLLSEGKISVELAMDVSFLNAGTYIIRVGDVKPQTFKFVIVR
ncbi:MAG: minor extracellular serine protease Vpr [Bacteroidia bacterium]|jgi:minor extracellular serine protease Vpr